MKNNCRYSCPSFATYIPYFLVLTPSLDQPPTLFRRLVPSRKCVIKRLASNKRLDECQLTHRLRAAYEPSEKWSAAVRPT